MFLLRMLLYRQIHKWSAKTATQWDDIIIAATKWAAVLWCLWLGLWAGWRVADLPPSGISDFINKIIPMLFVVFGIYTAVVFIHGTVKWYRVEIHPHTAGNLDGFISSFLMTAVPLVGIAVGVFIILKMLGYEMDMVENWLLEHGARLVLIAVLGLLSLLFTVLAIPHFIKRAVANSSIGQTDDEIAKRADTLITVMVTSMEVLILVVFVFMFLGETGVPIAPALAGVSIVGVAIGFGAQSLVKDVIAGLFVIMENQFRKGDVVSLAGVTGLVEDLNLRRTLLRDADGTVHVVPNGEVKVASNYTKQWSRVNLNIPVAYGTNMEHAIGVINRVCAEMAAEKAWADSFIKTPKVLRVDKLGESAIEIKIMGDTKPSRQWDVTGELRLRLLRVFEKEGIELPFNTTRVVFDKFPPPGWVGGGAEPESGKKTKPD